MKQQSNFQTLRIALFVCAMVAGCIIGFLTFLRPEMSESENRKLAELPEWNAEDFMNGTYTSEIGLWYSDTFPFRDELIDLNTRLRKLYGITTKTVVSGAHGDTIDTNGVYEWNTQPPAPNTDPSGTEPETPSETPSETQPSTGGHEVIEGYLVEGKTGYQLYYFNENNGHRFARAVVQAALDVEGRAQVYVMISPMAYEFGIPDTTRQDLGASDCKEAIDWYYNAIQKYGESAGLSTPVISVDAYSALEAHADEYIFFRTDHHWTALGAHYASRAFLDTAGRTYPTLKDGYTLCEIPGFTGSLANATKGETTVLVDNPDTIFAYIPNSTNKVTITSNPDSGHNYEEQVFEAQIVNPDPDAFYRTQKYRCFIDGDYPYSVVHNEKITDGSAILIIKDSYGNALTPMMVDSYEYVYVADHRWFRAMSISDMVETYGIDTVLFLNNPFSLAQDWNTGCIEKLVAIESKLEPKN